MPKYNILEGILFLLTSAVFISILFKQLKLPAVLGYLLIGIAVGPYGFALIPDKESIHTLADFGVVFLMFTIGLEFSLPKLLTMRRMVLGLGGLQVLLTTALTMGIAFIAGAHFVNALVAGGVVAMSSTALVSKQLKDQLELTAPHGTHAIGILLFQDLAVIPFLILIPSLSGQTDHHVWGQLAYALLKAGLVMLCIVLVGRKILKPIFRLIARAHSLELFTMAVLLITLTAAWGTQAMGLSSALGAFLAGMMLGETEFRHQIEIEIRPFRDVLLALFFISVGMLFNVFALPYMWRGLLILLATMIVFKALLISFLSRVFGASNTTAIRTGLVLAQGGEFGFALLTLAMDNDLLTYHYNQLILGALVLSMAISPFIIRYNKRISRFLEPKGIVQNEEEVTEAITLNATGLENHIILLGFGRVGQNIAKFLTIEGFQYLALDMDPLHVEQANAAGERVAYGDASNIQLLEAAHLSTAKALIISFHDVQTALLVIQQVRQRYSSLPILVRTRDDSDRKRLKQAGATEVIPETLEASLMLAFHILVMMDVPVSRAMRHVRELRNNRYALLNQVFTSKLSGDWDSIDGDDKERLYVVKIGSKAYAVGKELGQLNLTFLPSIVVTAIKRNNIRVPEPGFDTEIKEDDVIVLYGLPQELEVAEQILLQGP